MAVSLNVRSYGRGQPMVILHGLFGSAQNWHSTAERLSADFRVFACDLRNHGASPWCDTMTYAEMADDLEEVIAAGGLAPAVVLGHSVGGKTAMLSALRYPDVVEALIIVDIAPVRYEEPFAKYIEAMLAIDLQRVGRRADVEAALAPIVTDPGTRLFLMQNLEERDDGFAWRINLSAITNNLDTLLDFPTAAEATYEGRALFVSGERSDYIGRTTHARIYDLFPQAEFAVIAQAGHYPHVEQPEHLESRIADFLGSAYA